jgi:hypothetical protein
MKPRNEEASAPEKGAVEPLEKKYLWIDYHGLGYVFVG